MLLTRETRFWIGADSAELQNITNSWAGTSDNQGIGQFVVTRITVQGAANPETGYVCDIRLLDRIALEIVARQIKMGQKDAQSELDSAMSALVDSFNEARNQCPAEAELQSIELVLSPFTRLAIENGNEMMTKLTQSYEFSASHRLANPDLTDEENRAIFGKCSNPHGHGHNYVFEISLSKTGASTEPFRLGSVDRIVEKNVLEPFDHKNLNTQCPDFSDVNPTVENIAAAIFSRLDDKIENVQLESVRVWETPKTSATVTRGDLNRN